MLSVIHKKDNIACHCPLIMSPDSYIFFILVSGTNSTTIRNDLMVLSRIIEQVNAERQMQE